MHNNLSLRLRSHLLLRCVKWEFLWDCLSHDFFKREERFHTLCVSERASKREKKEDKKVESHVRIVARDLALLSFCSTVTSFSTRARTQRPRKKKEKQTTKEARSGKKKL